MMLDYESRVIKKHNLERLCWYVGLGTTTSVALWNGFKFMYPKHVKGRSYELAICPYYSKEPREDMFMPIMKVDISKLPSLNFYLTVVSDSKLYNA